MSSPDRSRSAPRAKVTTPGLRARKLGGQKITALTAYDYPTSLIIEAAGDIDLVLVGDSLANTALGYDSTLPVSMEEMLVAVRSVGRGLERPLLVADMPFGSYQSGDDDAMRAAVRFIQAGAESVKLEGGSPPRLTLVRRLVDSGIPAMGHIGLTPQSVHAMGGYKVQGKEQDGARALIEQAHALEDAGAFSIVLEGIPSGLAAEITAQLEIPTIGIGAGPHCDGQILVIADLLGMTPGRKPKFVRQYLDFHDQARKAVQSYCQDIRASNFPTAAESYSDPAAKAQRPSSQTTG